MRKVQNCNALTHKHKKETIAFTFNDKKDWCKPPSENFKKKSKIWYISNSSAPLRAARMSNMQKIVRIKDLLSYCYTFQSKLNDIQKTIQKSSFFRSLCILLAVFSEFIPFFVESRAIPQQIQIPYTCPYFLTP